MQQESTIRGGAAMAPPIAAPTLHVRLMFGRSHPMFGSPQEDTRDMPYEMRMKIATVVLKLSGDGIGKARCARTLCVVK